MPLSPSEAALDQLETLAGRGLALRPYHDDLLATIGELKICVAQGCAIASLSLCGKLMELALKLVLQSQRASYEDAWGMAALLEQLKKKCPRVELDPSMPDVARFIDQSRIPSLEVKVKAPVPTAEQVGPVVLAASELLTRAIALVSAS
jgi:hypothetical protein